MTLQNKEKNKRVNELALIKVELEQQNICLNQAAIVSETDANCNIIFVNDNFCKLYGYKKEELIGKNHRVLKSGKQPNAFFTDMMKTISSGRVFKGEILNKVKGDEKFFWMDITIVPFIDLNGKIIKYVAIMFDINTQTIQKEILLNQAHELALANTELALQNKEKDKRADELVIANKELAASTIKLNEALENQKELNKLKSRFVSTASHEFRTPLSAINFAAGSIKKHWAKMETITIEKKLDKIEEQVMYMTHLLDDILLVGEADAGKMKNNPLHVNFGIFIYNIIEEVYISRKKSHKIVLVDPEELMSTDIFIDEKLGRNIFINIISNAIKFSPNNKKIIIELSSEEKYIIFSITDFGVGIPKSEFKNIFTPFVRGKNVDLIPGTGLGLSIVKEAINVIKGEIIVNSALGKKTTFIVKIPKKIRL
ncbi:MAG: PAS domain S-box-containing protein [Mariniflexile sp.]|jgi:PAS domain S-box-containing protein